jgi:hypothetical protein
MEMYYRGRGRVGLQRGRARGNVALYEKQEEMKSGLMESKRRGNLGFQIDRE